MEDLKQLLIEYVTLQKKYLALQDDHIKVLNDWLELSRKYDILVEAQQK